MVEGTWVMGYFRDGENCQEPVILGSLPGRPAELAAKSKDFMILTEFIRNTKLK